MLTGWSEVNRAANEHARKSGVFLRLQNDGDKVVVAFCGEPYAREVVWTGERYESHNPDDPAQRGLRPTLRIMLNAYVPNEGAMKVLEGGVGWFGSVSKVMEKYGPGWLFEIERQGLGPKTKYAVLPERQMDEALLGKVRSAELHDLPALADGGSRDSDTVGAGARTSQRDFVLSPSDPIEDEDAMPLISRLKGLPRSDVEAFLGHFEVARVRDLKALQVPEAQAVLTRLEAAHVPAAAQEVDPFA